MIIGDEIVSQVTGKFNDIKTNQNLQIHIAFNTANTEKVISSVENSLVAHERANLTRSSGLQNSPRAPNFTMEDHWSSGLQRNSDIKNPQKTKGNRIKMGF